jgi:hypothetical protein
LWDAQAVTHHTPGDFVAGLDRVAFGREEVRRVVRQMDTPHELAEQVAEALASGTYDHARQLADHLLRHADPAFRHVVLESPDVFAIASGITATMGARSLLAANGGWIVLIDHRLMVYFYKIARAMALRIQVGTEPLSDHPLQFSADLVGEILEAVLTTGRPMGRDYPIEHSRRLFASNLATAAERFVVAHELAHHALGHTAPTTSSFAAAMAAADLVGLPPKHRSQIAFSANADLEIAVWNWDQEYEADAMAIRMTLTGGAIERVLDGEEVVAALAGVQLALGSLALLDDYRDLRGQSRSGLSTHPAAQGRLDRIHDQIEREVDSPIEATWDLAYRIGQIFDWIRVRLNLLPASWDSVPPD